ncbi:MAG: hypothetical protein ACI4E1_11565 [Lachnospira sp.]
MKAYLPLKAYLPFIGFMSFLVGLVILIIGATFFLSAKHQFSLFFDDRDKKLENEKKNTKEMKIGKILMIIGGVLMVLSFVLL